MHMVVTLAVSWFGVRIRVCASVQPELQHRRRTQKWCGHRSDADGGNSAVICRAVVRAGAAVAQASEGEADGL